jgi:hypothetical protein
MIPELQKIMENFQNGIYETNNGPRLLEVDLMDIQNLIDTYKKAIQNAYTDGYLDAEKDQNTKEMEEVS